VELRTQGRGDTVLKPLLHKRYQPFTRRHAAAPSIRTLLVPLVDTARRTARSDA
jgi:hypothetical protein